MVVFSLWGAGNRQAECCLSSRNPVQTMWQHSDQIMYQLHQNSSKGILKNGKKSFCKNSSSLHTTLHYFTSTEPVRIPEHYLCFKTTDGAILHLYMSPHHLKQAYIERCLSRNGNVFQPLQQTKQNKKITLFIISNLLLAYSSKFSCSNWRLNVKPQEYCKPLHHLLLVGQKNKIIHL